MEAIMRSRFLVPAVLFSTVLGACAEDVPEIRFVANRPLNDQCLPIPSGNVFIARGILDVFVADRYRFSPELVSELVPSDTVRFQGGAGGGAGGLIGNLYEANDVTLSRIVAEYEGPSALGVPLTRSRDIPVSGSIGPGASALLQFDLIPSQLTGLLAASPLLRTPGSSFTLSVRVKAYGATNDGREVDSNEFVYPILVCNGCLLRYDPEALDLSFPVPNCRNVSSFDSTQEELPCFPGQDEPVDCRAVCATVLGDEFADPFGLCDGG
jgi:hypothetical protein